MKRRQVVCSLRYFNPSSAVDHLCFTCVLLLMVIFTSARRITGLEENTPSLEQCGKPMFVQEFYHCPTVRAKFNVVHPADEETNFSICEAAASQLFILENHTITFNKDANHSESGIFDIVLYSAKKQGSTDFFSFQVKIHVNQRYCKEACPSSSSISAKHCTVVISFLASLSLILLTALSLTLIIIRRQKTLQKQIVFQPELNQKEGAESFITPRKTAPCDSPNISNGGMNAGETIVVPRKSSLKTPKLSRPDIVGDERNSVGYANNGYKDDDEHSQSSNRSNTDCSDGVPEARRKSVVTFNETAEVIQIASRLDKK